MSLHSPLLSSSERSDQSSDSMLPPQRVIERMSSYPSLSHSSTTATSDDPHEFLAPGEVLTPIDVSMMSNGFRQMDDEQESISPSQDGRKGFRGLTKSMHSLRGRAKSDKERSGSRERPPVPLVQPGLKVAAYNQATQPIAIPSSTAKPVRPKPQRSGSSFSSYIRKLTGKSSKPASPDSAPTALPPRQAASASMPRPSPPSRKPTLAINTGSPAPVVRPAHARKTSLPLDLVIPVNIERPIEPGPLTAPPRAPTLAIVDPRTVPLPPSPPSPAVVIDNEEEDLDFSLSPTSDDRLSAQISRSSELAKQINEHDEDEDEESEENDDIVNDLPSLTTQTGGRVATSPVSTLNDPDLRTPLSPVFPQNKDASIRSPSASGSSPPRNGVSFDAGMISRQDTVPRREPVANLGRKESKWRKSVMNLSDTLNGQSKRVSSKPPPSSYDSYQQQQQRIANNRRSCAPTLHSTATVSAEIRQIKDKEQQDMADTFFLS